MDIVDELRQCKNFMVDGCCTPKCEVPDELVDAAIAEIVHLRSGIELLEAAKDEYMYAAERAERR